MYNNVTVLLGLPNGTSGIYCNTYTIDTRELPDVYIPKPEGHTQAYISGKLLVAMAYLLKYVTLSSLCYFSMWQKTIQVFDVVGANLIFYRVYIQQTLNLLWKRFAIFMEVTYSSYTNR